MCEQCGCAATGSAVSVSNGKDTSAARAADSVSIELTSRILRKNDDLAAHNREHFSARGILAVNLMSSPGSGKTSLLETLIDALGKRWRIAVVEGDLETENDARRIRAKGIPAVQITTGQSCHLDASMVHEALHALDLDRIDILFIENVGNLVCPASFDLGQHVNIVLLAVTEGDDKPAKYPVMFRAADAILISKVDLLDVLDDFSPAKAEQHIRALANPAPIMRVSARRPESLSSFIAWLETRLRARRKELHEKRETRIGHFHLHPMGRQP